MLHAVIMAGGAGTRFWPASRAARPKQLLELVGDRTMMQATVDRLDGLVEPAHVLVVTNEALVAPIAEQLPELSVQSLIGEPCKRDTAPCVGLAAAIISRSDDDATMVVMPADHAIQTNDQFQQAIRRAAAMVDESPNRIVTFGIRPSYPAESFGYIERDESLVSQETDSPAFRVKMFREKPSAEVAEQYLADGGFYWNAGIFVWKARTILEALAEFEPEMYQRLMAIGESFGTDAFHETLQREFAAIEGKSIDYAVMERHDDVAVIEAPFDWDDVGNWLSLGRQRGTDENDNTIIGKHVGIKTQGCIVRSDDQHLVVTVGMQDCIVVHTDDATFVARKEDEEAVRNVVATLKERGWNEYL